MVMLEFDGIFFRDIPLLEVNRRMAISMQK